jgi:hypothetical protein
MFFNFEITPDLTILDFFLITLILILDVEILEQLIENNFSLNIYPVKGIRQIRIRIIPNACLMVFVLQCITTAPTG